MQSDLIKVLPDFVANQIAAGEVVQRPASVVKELLENSIDAEANTIDIVIKDAGKTLIQISDNGKGMSETDARMCFERHATSKIADANDLFSIRSMGFRGEAMASIASVARVELKTRRPNDELGTLVEIDGADVKKYEPVSTHVGTTISVKSLFFNIPARRKFLKSDNVETANIIEEVNRISLAFPEIAFKLIHNDKTILHLPSGNLKQRISNLFGESFQKKLYSIEENTSLLKISGFIGTPDASKVKRGHQYIFLNSRFVKYNLLSHAITEAYKGLIAEKRYPVYFLFIECDPKFIDINIHPTKTEVKFEDERTLYAILNAVVKKVLGKYHLAPTLDFESESIFPSNPSKQPVPEPPISYNPSYNPFDPKPGKGYAMKAEKPAQNWEELYSGMPEPDVNQQPAPPLLLPAEIEGCDTPRTSKIFCLQNTYIVSTIKSGLMIIDKTGALERIHYERLAKNREAGRPASQQLLFPEQIRLDAADIELLKDISDELANLGFVIGEPHENTVEILGIPAIAGDMDPKSLLEMFIDQYKENFVHLQDDFQENILISLSSNIAQKAKHIIPEEEMHQITDQLFACENPFYSPKGQLLVYKLEMRELAAIFRNNE